MSGRRILMAVITKTLPVDPRLLLQAVSSADDGIYITDPAGVIVFANDAILSITGYSREEFLGRKTSVFRSGLMSDEYYRRLWTTVLGGRTWRELIVNRRADGRFYDASQTISPVLDEMGRVQAIIAVQRDLTETTNLHHELDRSRDEVSRLLSEKEVLLREIYHRVKNDMEMVRSLLTMQAQRAGSSETRGELEDAARRISVISRTYSGFRDAVGSEDCLVADYFQSFVENWRDSILPPGTLFRQEVVSVSRPRNLVLAAGIIANELVTNAAKYTPREGFVLEVSLQVASYGDRGLVIRLVDNGPGLPEEVVSGRRRGLGLELVAALASRYGGELSLEHGAAGVVEVRLSAP